MSHCSPVLPQTWAYSQVSALCRGLLHADPSQRQEASEGRSLASWFVSRLEAADRLEANKSAAASCGFADASRGKKTEPQATACRVRDGSSTYGEGATILPPADAGGDTKRGDGVSERDTVAGGALSAEGRRGEPDELVR